MTFYLMTFKRSCIIVQLFFNISTSRLAPSSISKQSSSLVFYLFASAGFAVASSPLSTPIRACFCGLVFFFAAKESRSRTNLASKSKILRLLYKFGCCYTLFSKWIWLPKFLYQRSLFHYSGSLFPSKWRGCTKLMD